MLESITISVWRNLRFLFCSLTTQIRKQQHLKHLSCIAGFLSFGACVRFGSLESVESLGLSFYFCLASFLIIWLVVRYSWGSCIYWNSNISVCVCKMIKKSLMKINKNNKQQRQVHFFKQHSFMLFFMSHMFSLFYHFVVILHCHCHFLQLLCFISMGF